MPVQNLPKTNQGETNLPNLSLIRIDAIVEIDPARGVVYVHSKTSGKTLIRVSQIPVEEPLTDPEIGGMIDVTADKKNSGQARTN